MSLVRTITRFVTANSPTIMTVVGSVGVVTTAFLTGKAAIRASKKIYILQEVARTENRVVSGADKFKATWVMFIPSILSGAATISCLVGVNLTMTKRNAALLSLYGVADAALSDYKKKVVELLGDEKAQEVDREIVQDRITKNPPSDVIVASTGDVLVYDVMSDRYFPSNINKLDKVQNEINAQVIHESYALLNDVYSRVGLKSTPLGDDVGWNTDRLLEFKYSAMLNEEDRPCISLDYRVQSLPYKF